MTMADLNAFDVEVTWQRPDGTTVLLPACVCFSDNIDDLHRRIEVIVDAFDMNLSDFPEDLPEGSLPVKMVFR